VVKSRREIKRKEEDEDNEGEKKYKVEKEGY